MHEQLSVRASLAELCTYSYKENTYTAKKNVTSRLHGTPCKISKSNTVLVQIFI